MILIEFAAPVTSVSCCSFLTALLGYDPHSAPFTSRTVHTSGDVIDSQGRCICPQSNFEHFPTLDLAAGTLGAPKHSLIYF